MRCVRCQFENIPGQTRCIRCGSVLETGSAVVEVNPPRMPAWSKPLRGLMRWFRGHRVVPEKSFGRPAWQGLDRILSDNACGMLLSVVPGLAHLVKGRFKEVWLWVALWFGCMFFGLNLYGSQIGMTLIGLAIGLHAWIAVQYGIFREITDLAARIGLILIVVACLSGLYWAAPRVVVPGFMGAPTTLSIPAMNMRAGDYLLFRRVSQSDHPLARGSLVLVHPPSFRNGHRDAWGSLYTDAIGQIVGLPGETIRVEDGAYSIGGRRLDTAQFPVPRWLTRTGLTFETRVAPDSYFVSIVYTGGATPTTAMVRQACVVRAADIHQRAFMQWLPWTTRGFIE